MEKPLLTLTKIPNLNILVVKQRGIHYFVAAPDSIVIDKEGFLNLIRGAMNIDFITPKELEAIALEGEL